MKTIVLFTALTFLVACGTGTESSKQADSQSNSTSTTTQTSTSSEETSTGSISGKVQLSGLANHSGITVSAGNNSALTDVDGNYTVKNVPEGSYTISLQYNQGCEAKGTVKGHAVFSKPNSSSANVLFQYAPNCFVSQQIFAVTVFKNQTTTLQNVTLKRGAPARLTTVADANGDFSFSNIPDGNYSGLLPIQPVLGVGRYEQPIGTYALAIATQGFPEDPFMNLMRINAYPPASDTLRNDPYYQNSRPLGVAMGQVTDVGSVILYPIISVASNDAYFPSYPQQGLDFSADSSVSSSSSDADIYISYNAPLIKLNGVNNVQDGGETDMQSLINAHTDGYAGFTTLDLSQEIGGTTDWANYPEYYNHVFSVISKEGKYVKLKVLPGCTGSADNGMFRCYDVLYYNQGDGSSAFQY